ncbi:septum formation initiator family protein [Marinomonas mediterranea]|jgi:cell division protein FtsB|uniref:Cell division protein FtsB n=1 Tax=Marinomonas mediterranea (strain ATCC 700492 / JCM 21426 / NBRC 103028 / MMB-1) TaxID=717774 RepID=F2JUN4_MARM1|nr:septum formation initiator family protein [Marinomonas mediterranea]ADZ90449.1 Septum formation initiator [Marinomonas mediterranea MMB-1]WCN08505.1 septum formation inhibitor [Marinomonas mediterranea]WCN12560.1 septum formation inhibitor [Marinomonas mediterranea]WCN16632.1 septum formation inhibitor [Marinomonas mediterranea MMB-1]
MTQRIILITLFILVCVLSYRLYFGDQGIKRQEELAKQVEYQERINDRLRQRNDALRAQVSDLRQGEEAVEEHVRAELQYIKEGETFYRMVEK